MSHHPGPGAPVAATQEQNMEIKGASCAFYSTGERFLPTTRPQTFAVNEHEALLIYRQAQKSEPRIFRSPRTSL